MPEFRITATSDALAQLIQGLAGVFGGWGLFLVGAEDFKDALDGGWGYMGTMCLDKTDGSKDEVSVNMCPQGDGKWLVVFSTESEAFIEAHHSLQG
jgi:hypothetical protein